MVLGMICRAEGAENFESFIRKMQKAFLVKNRNKDVSDRQYVKSDDLHPAPEDTQWLG